MATTVSAPSHQSETARTKYCGGRGLKIGMMKTSSCGSPKRTWQERAHISTAQLHYNTVPQCVGMYLLGECERAQHYNTFNVEFNFMVCEWHVTAGVIIRSMHCYCHHVHLPSPSLNKYHA